MNDTIYEAEDIFEYSISWIRLHKVQSEEKLLYSTHTHTLTHMINTHIWYIYFATELEAFGFGPMQYIVNQIWATKSCVNLPNLFVNFFTKRFLWTEKPTPCQWAYYIINIHKQYIYDIYIYVHNPCVSMCLTKITWIVDNKKVSISIWSKL